MPSSLQNITDRFERLDARKTNLKVQVAKRKTLIDLKKKEEATYVKARWVLAEVGRITQETFKDRVESLVTLAIRSVYDRPFQFELKFEQQRNKAVCLPIIKEDDFEQMPKDDMGGGIIDLVSFAFRVILWSLERPQSRNVFILDEPMKFIGKGELLQKAGRMLRELSHRLGFQLIVITHEPELAEIADKAYMVTHNGKQSKVEELTAGKPTLLQQAKKIMKAKPKPKRKLIRRKSNAGSD